MSHIGNIGGTKILRGEHGTPYHLPDALRQAEKMMSYKFSETRIQRKLTRATLSSRMMLSKAAFQSFRFVTSSFAWRSNAIET